MSAPGKVPRVGRGVLWRGAAAALLVVACTAGAAVGGTLFQLHKFQDDLIGGPIGRIEGAESVDIPEVTEAEAGGPRTFLILGSDQRYAERNLRNVARSDTILLVRVDPPRKRIATLSIPRDLKVPIPGVGEAKVNRAYQEGGPRKTVETLQELFSSRLGEKLEVNSVVNVNFGGFQEAVNYVGGVYVDVDHRYLNDNSSGATGGYASIDVQPGYQRLVGSDALAYVRFRHTDSDLYRAARQQDFLRQMSAQGGTRRLLDIGHRTQLARAFGRYLQVDKRFLTPKNMLSLLHLGAFLAGNDAPVNQVRFPAVESGDGTDLEVSDRGLRRVYDEFVDGRGATNPRRRTSTRAARASWPSGLTSARSEGRRLAALADPKLDFPFSFPTLRPTGSHYDGDGARVYTIEGEDGKRHAAYRLVLSTGRAGEYLGVQGTTWKDPPLLATPDRTRTVNGRKLDLFYDGRHIRLVAWRTPRATYWVSNTLNGSVANSRLIAVAGSLSRLHQ